MAILLLDLDKFKVVNDSLGYASADIFLQEIARRLRGCAGKSSMVARLGGDEFGIIVQDCVEIAELHVLAKQLIERVGDPYDANGYCIQISATIGIAVAAAGPRKTNDLLNHAEIAVHQAKRDAYGSVRFYDAAISLQLQQRRELETDLRLAIQRNEFELFYQPIVSLKHNEVCGFEALLRWHHPTRGMVMPNEFVVAAEETGLIVQIGAWALRSACVAAAGWQMPMRIAINISVAQLKRSQFLQTVEEALAISALPPERLDLEITESVMLTDNDDIRVTLHKIRAMGVQVSMDDFGTGYSSLGYLNRFPFNRIKIDRSFVSDLAASTSAIAVVRAILGLGGALGMATTAEGVESVEAMNWLRREGCDEVQGYLFSVPRPGDYICEFTTVFPAMMQNFLQLEAARSAAA